MEPRKVDEIIRLFPCFSYLSAQDWAQADTIRVAPSTLHPIAEGHYLKHAIFVLSGCIRIYKIGASGREVTLYRVRSGECCVLMMASILGETPYEASVQIESETDIALFPVEPFRKWMHDVPSVRKFIYRQFMDRFIHVSALLEQIAFGSVQERVAAYIMQRHEERGSDSEWIVLTHEQMAVDLGTAREVVSRMLRSFAQEGAIIVRRGKIAVADTGKLTSYASPL
ncbi:Crp/Fnr family transcriptional regulator [Paenibacillus doosanensis]|uniref:Crp/Fnr family transcriptional regulator n=1 Tax=Paenibacillus doosanensis TaxID=1229154 RepID=UPI0021807A2F|nr:Crp/Fnr family transcriptional regulator [Paenibacillus doosanensis]MCS7459696.1 Crp/Fnr family transcriptional regulator [Paenibacillus doosanensis]